MKNIGLILLCFLISFNLSAQKNCTYTITPANPYFDGSSVPAGSSICIEAGNYDYLHLKNIKGTAAKPITIVNNGKVVINTDHYFGIKIAGCQHVKLIAESVSGSYGIAVLRVAGGAGLSIDELSTDIEIAGLEIANTSIAGIMAKTEPNCSGTSLRENFTMYNLIVRDCYLHDIADEGMYIGSSKYTGQEINCNGSTTTVLPHVIEGVQVYNNIVERTGWDGIQVSSTTKNCRIYNNIIRHDSQSETVWQMSGILIGGGSTCDCYNNRIYDGKGDGIDVLGKGTSRIYNNLIVRAGKSYDPSNATNYKHGIYVGPSPDGAVANYYIIHNTIVSPKSDGIYYNNSNTNVSMLANNLIVSPGTSHINYNSGMNQVVLRTNYLANNSSEVRFENSNQDKYDLLENSPAINYGTNLHSNGVNFDIMGRPRPYKNAYDAGAYQYNPDYDDISEFELGKLSVHPQPATTFVKINGNFAPQSSYECIITNVLGQTVTSFTTHFETGTEELTIDTESLISGCYILKMSNKRNVFSEKIIIQ